ncbi:hypothetical protein [Endobacterium cereale]|uniref:hypothetical protein n=1 Tax=Endobacterium cereale TaxID=2663029 RepID=UPI002B48FD3E|nr:hypothetical protein [Endobacterium cereale]MEB2846769.1 hypothetical protein [Endobacterium cereale]
MKTRFSPALLWGLVTLSSPAAAAPYESDYRDMLCRGMRTEVSLPNGTRADCIGRKYAVEVEYSNKWAEAIGQALSYSAATGKKPGIILVCRQNMGEAKCQSHELLIRETAARWRLPIAVWACAADARRLEDCRQHQLADGW